MLNKRYLFIDLETTGLHEYDDRIHGMAVAREEGQEAYYPIYDLPDWIKQDLADPNVIKVFHSGSRFDMIFLIRSGFEVRGPLHDTYHIFKMLDENQPLDLKSLVRRYRGPQYLKAKRALDRICAKEGVKSVAALCKMDLADKTRPYLKIIAKYGTEDVENTLWLYFHGKEELKKLGRSIRKMYGPVGKLPAQFLGEVVFPLEEVLLAMDKRGVKADMNFLENIRKKKEREMLDLQQQMYKMTKRYVDEWEERAYHKARAARKTEKGKAAIKRRTKGKTYNTKFNWDSQAVVDMVYSKVPNECIVRTEKTGRPSLNKEGVQRLYDILPKGHVVLKFLDIYSKYQKAKKIASTYTGNAKRGIYAKLRNGRLWTNYYQLPKTWRLASKNMNLQNLPRGSIVHKFFIPDTKDHVFYCADYSQIELRVAAHYSQDEKMIEAYRLKEDIHAKTAGALFTKDSEAVTKEERAVGKTANFLLSYLGSWKKLQFMLKKDADLDVSDDSCKFFVGTFFELYVGLRRHLYQLVRQGQETGHIYIPETGAIRRVPNIVYGQYLNWDKKRFTGPTELATKLIEQYYIENPNKKDQPLSKEDLFWEAYRKFRSARNQLVNFPCQHLAAVITAKAMIKLHKEGFDIVNQVHDEIKVQLKKSEIDKATRIKEIMETAYTLKNIDVVAEGDIRTSFSKEDVV